MKKIFFVLNIVSAFIVQGKLFAQALPVGTPVLDDYYRREQLLGKVDSNLSFSVRPINPTFSSKIHNIYDPDSTLSKDHWVQAGPVSFAHGAGAFQILPLTWQQQFNSNHP